MAKDWQPLSVKGGRKHEQIIWVEYDIQMMPISKELPGFIFELKYGNDSSASGLKELAKAALQQIADKRYVSDMSSKGIEPVICYGLAFSGKHVEISCSVSA